MSFGARIDKLCRQLRIHQYQSELEYLEDEGGEWNEERINQLQYVVVKLSRTAKQKQNQAVLIAKKQLDDAMEKNMFNKPWRYMPNIHRSMKLKEYYQEDLELEGEEFNNLVNQTEDFLEQGLFNGSKNVDYSVADAKVLSVKYLVKNNDIWELVCKKKKTDKKTK